MAVDNDREPERGLKRLREDEEPLVFKHIKRIQCGDILETTEESIVPKEELPRLILHGACKGEGLSDPYAEIW